MGRLGRAGVGLWLVGLGACQTVGLPEPDPRPSPTPQAATPPADPVERPPLTSPTPPRITFGGEFAEHGLDAILHSPVAADAQFQDQVAFWIRFWTTQQADYFGRYLDRMGQYEWLVDGELEARGLPASLRYLPIVESGYHPGIVSRAGATGMWQIMAPTAGDLGLAVGSLVDDRRDPVAATRAALDYLEQLHRQFNSWFLALAAYNAGQGRVGSLLDRHASAGPESGDARFLEIRAHLPAETREFVPRFFAAAALASNAEAHGFRPSGSLPFAFDEVVVPDATSLDVVAWAAGVPEEEILALNPHFLRGFTPPGEVRTVRVPAGRATRFELEYAQIPPQERLSVVEHVVAQGETLSHIARRYGVTVAELTDSNGGVDPRRLQIGMRLIVPLGMARVVSQGPAVAQVASVPSGGPSANGVHRVAPGESLWTIARRYGLTTSELAAANGKSPDAMVRVGEELVIP